MNPTNHPTASVELSAVIVAVANNEPQVMVLPGRALPSGPFGSEHRTLEQALRAWVTAQSGLTLGYVEQLYTFADKDRTASRDRTVSIGYLALVRSPDAPAVDGMFQMTPWYSSFPWEDRRTAPDARMMGLIYKGLERWRCDAPDAALRHERALRIAINFPKDERRWNEELVLQRYELLWEAGLIHEAWRGRGEGCSSLGMPMMHDHRRILATAIARLRAKIKYRPVVFELMPEKFTLLQLQQTVEALSGLRLHKQNFRRLVQGQGLVEETSGQISETRGRPAQLFAFRREVLRERAAAGTKLPRGG